MMKGSVGVGALDLADPRLDRDFPLFEFLPPFERDFELDERLRLAALDIRINFVIFILFNSLILLLK